MSGASEDLGDAVTHETGAHNGYPHRVVSDHRLLQGTCCYG